MLEIEKIAAKKFVEIKGMEYLDIDKYTMTKNVTDIKDIRKDVILLLMKVFHGMKRSCFM